MLPGPLAVRSPAWPSIMTTTIGLARLPWAIRLSRIQCGLAVNDPGGLVVAAAVLEVERRKRSSAFWS